MRNLNGIFQNKNNYNYKNFITISLNKIFKDGGEKTNEVIMLMSNQLQRKLFRLWLMKPWIIYLPLSPFPHRSYTLLKKSLLSGNFFPYE
jgi:hypothetical protein